MVAQLLIFTGVLCIITGFILFFIASFMSSSDNSSGVEYEYAQHQVNNTNNSEQIRKASEGVFKRSEIRGGGIIMIGPIPIILGTDSKSAQIVIMLAIVLMLMAFFLFRQA
ncbi:MAG: DUF131 domain-containing protein [Methanomethylovorans sp.]|uniref:TIGR00304 family membrane protein n=1 Tax=Methanomethylovorans sp. TaxID=2758717 RepID=UPI0035306C5B